VCGKLHVTQVQVEDLEEVLRFVVIRLVFDQQQRPNMIGQDVRFLGSVWQSEKILKNPLDKPNILMYQLTRFSSLFTSAVSAVPRQEVGK
jgi:hypothetical protein